MVGCELDLVHERVRLGQEFFDWGKEMGVMLLLILDGADGFLLGLESLWGRGGVESRALIWWRIDFLVAVHWDGRE